MSGPIEVNDLAPFRGLTQLWHARTCPLNRHDALPLSCTCACKPRSNGSRRWVSLAEVAADARLFRLFVSRWNSSRARRRAVRVCLKRHQDAPRTTRVVFANSVATRPLRAPSKRVRCDRSDGKENSKDTAMQLPGLVVAAGRQSNDSATSTWANKVTVRRGALWCIAERQATCRPAIRVAREQNLPLSVRGGGHDWAGRALCDGVVIDLTGMRSVILETRPPRRDGRRRGARERHAHDRRSSHVAVVAGAVG